MADKPERTTIDFDSLDINIPEVKKVGRYRYVRAQERLKPHRHRNSLEICYLAKGKQIYEVEGTEYSLSGGNVFITLPNEIHSTGKFPEEKGMLYWLILKISDNQKDFFNQSGETAENFKDMLISMPSRCFSGSDILLYYFDEIIAYCQDEDRPLRKIAIENLVLALLLEVISCSQKKESTSMSPAIKRVKKYIGDNLDRDISVEDMADISGLSTHWFKEKFKKETGLSPADFVSRRKIEEAKKRLRSSKKSITEIAFTLGFSSSQYFATVFKRYTGITPTDFRKES